MLNSAITSWLADPSFPVETGLAEASEFALDTLRAEGPAARPRAPRRAAEADATATSASKSPAPRSARGPTPPSQP